MLTKVSTWSCLELRMQDAITVSRLLIVPLEGWNSFKCLGTSVTYQNSILEEIKRKQKSGNACCHSVQNLLSSSLLSKNIKIKIRTTIILPGV